MAQVPISAPDNRSVIPVVGSHPIIDLNDIQGDIYPTFPKKVEQFIFFSIADVAEFRKKLGEFRENLTSSAQVIKYLEEIEEARQRNKGIPKPLPKERLVKLSQFQIGFSLSGLKALGTVRIGDSDFDWASQRRQAEALGDEPVPGTTGKAFVGQHWTPDWREKRIDGVILAASESSETCNESVAKVIQVFGPSINVEIIENGQVRPGKEEGHEHFGFLDGVSQPSLNGLSKRQPGQLPCDPGIIIMGLEGDKGVDNVEYERPPWAVGGSIMAFRKLHQRVPEFNKFLDENPIKKHGLTHEEGVALRGARMVGRWKSGVPIDLSPEEDDHDFLDPEVINNFDYQLPEPGQARCPFSAHIRKTSPRVHLDKDPTRPVVGPSLPHALIMRAGIPYGPEVTPEESDAQATSKDRGLLFVSYQSVLGTFGFNFIQKLWANNANFPPKEFNSFDNGKPAGLDPIIGNKVGESRVRTATGLDAMNTKTSLTMNDDFVIAEGGEYFFVPPLKTIDKISAGEVLPAPQPSTRGGTAGAFNGPSPAFD